MWQKKEQGKKLQEQLNEEDIESLPEEKFRIMTVKMIQDLKKRMEAWIKKIQEMFNRT